MRKKVWVMMICLTMGLVVAPTKQSHAVVWVVIQEALKKAILAIDAQIQRLQNETIGLQNAQKAIENVLSKLKLQEISDWAEKQRKLYDDYYQELWKIKNAIGQFNKVREIVRQQARLVESYKKAHALLRQDDNFTPAEREHMEKVYAGIISASIRNLDQLFLVINAFKLQMSDGSRLELISGVAEKMQQLTSDLQRFNNEAYVLSLQRARNLQEVDRLKALYEMP